MWHYLDDGIYGSYSNVMTEDVHPPILAMREVVDGASGYEPVTLAGPTCDSADVIARDYPMPTLNVGDVVVSPMMGAYTSVTSSRFNGIPATADRRSLTFLQRERYPRRLPPALLSWHTMTTERIADHVQFAYWVPNVSGGLVTSDIEQRTDWGYDYNVKLAQTAENNGFDYALSQVRYEASYGAEYQHESTSFSLALLLATQRLKVIAAVHPGLWQPAVLAKLGATADHLSNGRFAVNVVSGWFKDEFTHLGEPWLEHDERYRRSAEFLQVLRKIWTEDDVDFRGDFYRIHDFTLKPKPLNTPHGPTPRYSRAATRRRRGATAVATPTGTSPTARTSTG